LGARWESGSTAARVVEDVQRLLMDQEELTKFKAETIKDLLVREDR